MNQDKNLVRFSESAAAIAEMKQKYTGLTVKDVKDTAGLKRVREARLEVKNTRVALVKYAKDLKADALAYLNRVNGQLNPLVKEMEAIEDPLWEEEQRIAKEKEKLAEQKIQARIDQLGQYKATFDYQVVKKMSDKDFKKYLKEAKAAYELAEYNRIAAEAALKQIQNQEQQDNKESDLRNEGLRRLAHEEIVIGGDENIPLVRPVMVTEVSIPDKEQPTSMPVEAQDKLNMVRLAEYLKGIPSVTIEDHKYSALVNAIREDCLHAASILLDHSFQK